MATEEKKKQNMARLANLTLFGVTAGIWDFVGESSFALTGKIGDEVLKMMEKEMGLEVAGEKPIDILTEIGRLFVDEYGFAGDIEVAEKDGSIIMKVSKCLNRNLSDKLTAAGVEKPFICPIMNAGLAALKRLNVKTRPGVEKWVEGKGSIITLDLM